MSLTDLQDAKEQIRQAVDIVDLVGSYLALRRQGSGYVALCPWHDDSRPSLQVNPARQSFKCWVCDLGGDIFSFMMKMENIEFREALEMLADRAGIELKPPGQGSEASGQFDRRSLFRLMAWAEEEFHLCLLHAREAEPAREYLVERGISDESVRRFRLGFSPPNWDWLLKRAAAEKWPTEALERVGLVLRRQSGPGHYDRFRGRLLFSIRDTRSRPIAFGGRVLPGVGESNPDVREAKYINSPETPLFSKSSQLYGLDLAREGIDAESGLVVMEGYTDVIMAHQHGVINAVAVLGTALGERHVPLVRRFTERVTLVLDGDAAGQTRTMQILDELLALFVKQEIDLRILTLPEGADPCDVIRTHGSDSFKQLLSAAADALDHKILAVTNGLATAPGTHASAQAVEDILGTLARALPSHGGSSTALIREQQLLNRLSHEFGLAEDTLRTRLVVRRRELSRRAPNRHRVDESPSPHSLSALNPWERELLELLIHQPQTLHQLAVAIAPEDIPHAFCRRVYQTALDAHAGGREITFDRLMLSTDDAEEKNLLVACDEAGQMKTDSDTAQRLRDLVRCVEDEQNRSRRSAQLAVFHKKTLEDPQEDEELNRLFQDLAKSQQSRRQAGSSPTEG